MRLVNAQRTFLGCPGYFLVSDIEVEENRAQIERIYELKDAATAL